MSKVALYGGISELRNFYSGQFVGLHKRSVAGRFPCQQRQSLMLAYEL
jgi:hypothetical protein